VLGPVSQKPILLQVYLRVSLPRQTSPTHGRDWNESIDTIRDQSGACFTTFLPPIVYKHNIQGKGHTRTHTSVLTQVYYCPQLPNRKGAVLCTEPGRWEVQEKI